MPYDPATPSHKRNASVCSTSDFYKNVHSSTTHNSQNWKRPKCPPTVEWINTGWHIQIIKNCTAMKIQKLLLHSATWLNLTKKMRTKRSQIQQSTIPFTLMENSTKSLSRVIRVLTVVTLGRNSNWEGQKGAINTLNLKSLSWDRYFIKLYT